MLKKWSPQKWVSSSLYPLYPINLQIEIRPKSTEVCSFFLHPHCYYLVQVLTSSDLCSWNITFSSPCFHSCCHMILNSFFTLHSRVILPNFVNRLTSPPAFHPHCLSATDLLQSPRTWHSLLLSLISPLLCSFPTTTPTVALWHSSTGGGAGAGWVVVGEMSHYLFHSHIFDACDCLCP